MGKEEQGRLIAALDIGTSKVVAIVGRIQEDDVIDIVGLGSAPCKGLRRGSVVNIESTVQSIQAAVEQAELMSGCQIHSVYVGISGSHVNSYNSHGVEGIQNQEVSRDDIERVIDSAKAVAIPNDQSLLHILPQEYSIDKQGGIREPLGMTGVRLETYVHLVSVGVSAVQNLEKCITRCGLRAEEFILEQLASGDAVLTQDEKELGVCVVDIGGGTTDIAVYIDGAVRHSAVIPMAGDQVTDDIAMALKVPADKSDDIKVRYACALVSMTNESETVSIPGVGDRPARVIRRADLADIVERRYAELFTRVCDELDRHDLLDRIPAGLVLSGGGANIQGAVDLAEAIIDVPIRVGLPQHFSGMVEAARNPIYATAVGLLLYGKQLLNSVSAQDASLGRMKSVFSTVRNWITGNL